MSRTVGESPIVLETAEAPHRLSAPAVFRGFVPGTGTADTNTATQEPLVSNGRLFVDDLTHVRLPVDCRSLPGY